MRARWYDPAIGRFISPDPIIPDPTNPQSLNRYSYVYNNPVRYTDSTGHCIDGLTTATCLLLAGILITTAESAPGYGNLALWVPLSYPRITTINGTRAAAPSSSDVTAWLVDQMVTTSNSQTVADMQSFWSGTITDKFSSLAAWTAMVRTGSVWDFKPDLLDAGVVFGTDRLITLGSYDLNYQAVANIFFGFIGRQIGMSETMLQLGAGIAQAEHGAAHWYGNLRGYPAGFGDQHFDAWSIGFGFYLFDLYGSDLSLLTEDALAQALTNYIMNNPIPSGP